MSEGSSRRLLEARRRRASRRQRGPCTDSAAPAGGRLAGEKSGLWREQLRIVEEVLAPKRRRRERRVR